MAPRIPRRSGGSGLNIEELTRHTRVSPVRLAAIAAALLVLPPILELGGTNYPVFICCMMIIYVIAVSGLDIVFGYSGQISLGHGAFYALGAYGSGLLLNKLGVPAVLGMFIAAGLAAAVGALLAWPASKLVFHFLSLSTVAFGEIVYQAITHSPYKITGDFVGLRSGFVSLFGFTLNSPSRFYYFALACMTLLLLAKTRLIDSKVGRAFIAIRENAHAANGMGINVHKYKILAFTISAFFTAFAGAMYMHLVRYASPDLSMARQSVLFLTMLLFGGTGSLLGPVCGVISVSILIEFLRSWQEYQMLIYGVLMLIVIVGLPGGLYGAIRDIWSYLTRRKGAGSLSSISESVRKPRVSIRAGSEDNDDAS